MWNKGLRTVGLVTAASILAAGCAGGAGKSIAVTPRLAMEHGREALDLARHTVGSHDVTAEDVVQAFDDVIAHDPLKDWWRAEVVGEAAQISFLMISAEYQRAHPDVTYPLVKAGDSADEAHGLGIGEAVIPASEDQTPPPPSSSPSSPSAPTTVAGQAPEVTIESPEVANATPADTLDSTDAGHADDKAADNKAAALPDEAFEVAVAACVREISGEMRVRTGPCPSVVEDGSHSSGTAAAAAWSYDGETGQDVWGELSAEYALCATGTQQSPIDLKGATAAALEPIHVKYNATPAQAFSNGHTLEVAFDLGSSVEINQTLYRLTDVQYRSPSEHTIDGKSFPLELQFAHRDYNSNVAIVSVLVQEGEHNDTWAPLLSALSKAPKTGQVAVGKLNIQQMLTADAPMYRYRGSITTPPCTEGVTWSVVSEPITVSAQQIDLLQRRYDANARKTQPLGDRQLLVDEQVG